VAKDMKQAKKKLMKIGYWHYFL